MRINIISKFEGPNPKHCQVIKLFSTKDPGDLDLCPQDHLLVRTSISTKFEGPNRKHCKIISCFGTGCPPKVASNLKNGVYEKTKLGYLNVLKYA